MRRRRVDAGALLGAYWRSENNSYRGQCRTLQLPDEDCPRLTIP
jgi:hypothetical protein